MARDVSFSELLPSVVSLVAEASRAVMRIYDSTDMSVEFKSDDSPVTSADLAANHIIIDGLRALTPTIPVVSEEWLDAAADIGPDTTYWLVDPVDGTKEFISHNGEFTVNVGLIENGEPVLGVVDAPAVGKKYYGAAGLGAWLQEHDLAPRAIRVNTSAQPRRVAVSRSHLDDATRQWLTTHGFDETQQLGSSLKIVAVADGGVDLSPRLTAGLHEWDLAAADAVLRAAGGAILYLDGGNPLRYGSPLKPVPAYLAGGPDAVAFTV